MKKVPLWEIFAAFAKIGAFTIGGGYVMIPAIQDEMSRRGWLAEEELPDIVAIAQSAPGLLTVNMSIFAGYRLRGVAGSVAATLGCITAPFAIILLIAMFLRGFADNPVVVRIFTGVRPAAVAVMFAFTVKLARSNGRKAGAWALSAATLLAMVLFHVSPIFIIAAVIAAAVALSFRRTGK